MGTTSGRPSGRLLSPVAVVESGCVVGALLLTVMNWAGWLVVVLGRAVPLWVPAAALLFVALGLVVWAAASRRSPWRVSQRSRLLRWSSIVVAVAAAGGVALAAAADLAFGATYSVLEPSAPSGCRAVVRETSFLFGGSGEVYAVSGWGVGHRVGSWGVDDGYRPIANGHYEVQWGGDGGVLRIWGGAQDPIVGNAMQELNC